MNKYELHETGCQWHENQREDECTCAVRNQPYVILFNGPPRVGKDTIADLLMRTLYGGSTMRRERATFKEPMMKAALEIFGIPEEEYDARKDQPHPTWGISLREWMIDFSESFMKPRFGKDVWGAAAHSRIDWWGTRPGIVVFTDLGFREEYEFVVSQTVPHKVATVQVTRGGVDWANDSRRYVDTAPGTHLITLSNDGTPHDAMVRLWGHLRGCFGSGWFQSADDEQRSLFTL